MCDIFVYPIYGTFINSFEIQVLQTHVWIVQTAIQNIWEYFSLCLELGFKFPVTTEQS